jgi:YHS domain-containing protein
LRKEHELKKSTLWSVFLILSFAFVLAGLAQQKADETAGDPVCGMTVNKATAKATFEYKGATYYFCSEGCKEAFAKNPEKYLAKPEETKAGYTCPMHPDVKSDAPGKCPKCGMALKQESMPHGQMMAGRGKGMSGCPLHSADVEIKVENSADGVSVKISSKNPETVKKVQEHFASGMMNCPKSCCAQKEVK